MPRVHQQKARKDYPDAGIKAGDVYYKWTTRAGPYTRGVVHRSLERPMPWQLTSSPFLQQRYLIEHNLGEIQGAEAASEIESIAEEIRSLGEECQASLENMPEGLQQGATGEMLQERVDACETAADVLDDIVQRLEPDPDEPMDEEELEELLDEARGVTIDC